MNSTTAKRSQSRKAKDTAERQWREFECSNPRFRVHVEQTYPDVIERVEYLRSRHLVGSGVLDDDDLGDEDDVAGEDHTDDYELDEELVPRVRSNGHRKTTKKRKPKPVVEPEDDEDDDVRAVTLADQSESPKWTKPYLVGKRFTDGHPLSRWQWLVQAMPTKVLPMRSRAAAFALVTSALGEPYADLSQRWIAGRMGTSTGTVALALGDLERAGFIVVERDEERERARFRYWLSWPVSAPTGCCPGSKDSKPK